MDQRKQATKNPPIEHCPFCGHRDAQTVKHSSRWGWFVSCRCGAVGPSSHTKAEAVEAWNSRPEPIGASVMQPALELGC